MAKPIKPGDVFGRWTVIRKNTEQRAWLCRCLCGRSSHVQPGNLRGGYSRSCGCLRAEVTGKRSSMRTTHGQTQGGRLTPEFKAYWSMRSRCYRSRDDSYPHYGGRGITVCDRWLHGEDGLSGVECFLKDMGKRPDGTTLDRINNDEDYSPQNCRWATPTQQIRNRRNTRWVFAWGQRIPLSEALARAGLSRQSFDRRVKMGMPESEAVELPKCKKGALREQIAST